MNSSILRPDPEHVKLTSEELSSVIAQQKNNLKEQEEEEEGAEEQLKMLRWLVMRSK